MICERIYQLRAFRSVLVAGTYEEEVYLWFSQGRNIPGQLDRYQLFSNCYAPPQQESISVLKQLSALHTLNLC
jgi:hypothetical protein